MMGHSHFTRFLRPSWKAHQLRWRHRLALCVGLLLFALAGSLPHAASTEVGGGGTLLPDRSAQGYKFGTIVRVRAPEAATTFRFLARGGDSGQRFVPVVYAVGPDGLPKALVTQGAEVTVRADRAEGWVETPLQPVVLSPGNYLLGLIAGPAGRGAQLYFSSGGRSFWNANAFPQADPVWGSIHPDDVTWAFALGPTSGSPPPTAAGRVPGTGCPAFPAFPDKACTGVPAGTALVDYTGGDVVEDRAVISNVRISSAIDVRANDVTFRNCLIQSNGPIAIAVARGFNGLTLENCTFKSGGFIAPFSGLTLRRILVDPDPGAYRPDGIVVGFSSIGHNGQNILIEDSYIGPQWGQGGPEPDHSGGLQIWGFGTVSNVVIRHNWIDSSNTNPDPTAIPVGSCAFLADATYVNVTFEYNYCVKSGGRGGYFHLRLASNSPTGGHVIRGNRFANRGSTTPVDLYRATPGVWSDNRFADNDELIPQPAVRG